jgi:hypothetical protein
LTETRPETEIARRDCAVFVTHVWTPEVAAHYARLKREAGRVLDVVLVYQQGDADQPLPPGMAADLVVRVEDSARHFPRRFAQHADREPRTLWGYVDLVWLTAFLSDEFAAYQRFWLVEYDVDFSGDWTDFFAATSGYDGDLLSARVRPLSLDPDFWFASSFQQPGTAIADPLIAFMPISRLSRPLIEHYRDTVQQPGWAGHFEMLLPSIAAAGGFVVADLGGNGPFVPPERINLYYEGALEDRGLERSTHGFRPPRGYQYFAAAPQRFRRPNQIYHPIKVGMPLEERRKHWWSAQRQRLRQLGRRLRGKS